jgi:ATP-binding cassette, subfamily B, bacterial
MRDTLPVVRVVGVAALRADPALALAVAALRVGAALLMPLDAVALGMLVDAALRGALVPTVAWAAFFALCDAGSSALNHPAGKLELTLREKVNFAFEQRIVRGATERPTLEHLERPEYLDRVEVARNHSSSLGDLVSQLIGVGQVIVLLAVTVTALITVYWVLALLALFAVPAVLFSGRAGTLRQDAEEAVAADARLSDRLYDLTTQRGPAVEIRILGIGQTLINQYREVLDQVIARRDRAARQGMVLVVSGWLIFSAGFLAAIGLVLWQAVHGQATPGQVLLVLALAVRLNDEISEMTNALVGARQALVNARRLVPLIEVEPDEPVAGRMDRPAAAPDAGPRGTIEVRGVSFRYPGTEAEVLRDVNLRLPAGSTVALVGENGVGKTTLVKLLCGFYPPTSGEILVGGVRLADLPPQTWWADLTACFQDYVRLELLVREAVGVGRLEAIDSVPEIERAVGQAGAGDVVAALPHGLETQLGARWPGGVDLSLGQWQKLALARATMRTAPVLLVLDEPTASLDTASEHALFERFSGASRRYALQDAITLLVSHRFSTVRMADQIVVLDGGGVVETGSHEELMRRGGQYAELFEIQARSYGTNPVR